MTVHARAMAHDIIVKYNRSILASLIVSKSTPKAGNLDVNDFKFLAISKMAMIPAVLIYS